MEVKFNILETENFMHTKYTYCTSHEIYPDYKLLSYHCSIEVKEKWDHKSFPVDPAPDFTFSSNWSMKRSIPLTKDVMFSCVKTTPLGSPLVPLVYTIVQIL